MYLFVEFVRVCSNCTAEYRRDAFIAAEAEKSRVAQGTERRVIERAAERMCTIFYHKKIVFLCDVPYRGHVGSRTERVLHNNCLGLARDFPFEVGDI